MGRDGTLHVATTSSTWAFELDRLSPEIQERLDALAGASSPKKLSFRVGPVPEPGSLETEEVERADEALAESPEIDSQAASIASAIDDPELREIVARWARASIRKARSGRHF